MRPQPQMTAETLTEHISDSSETKDATLGDNESSCPEKSEDKSATNKESEDKPVTNKESEDKSATNKESDGKPATNKESEGKPATNKESEGKPATNKDDELKTRKDQIKAELEKEQELYEPPVKVLDDVIRERQGEEKGVFEGLVKENVVLEREKRKLEEKLMEAKAKLEVLEVEAENRKQKYEKLENKNRSMELKIKDLNKDLERTTKRAAKSSEDNNNGPHTEEDDPNQTERIRDLQFRLLRLTNDMEEKDRDMEKLGQEKEELAALVRELSSLVDSAKVTEVKEKVKSQFKDQEDQSQKTSERANVVKQSGSATNSKICAVM